MKKEFEFQNKIKAFCRQKELFARGDRVVLGLSGGADSVCLFLVLEAFAKEWELELIPVHVNHNLRGTEADADQKFCEELCRQHNLKLQVASVQVAELAAQNGWTLEEAGRNARYQVFKEIQTQRQGTKIAVAHHKNDQAETVLFQLLRGSRLKGLSGMEVKNKELIRPLLCVTREEIEDYLKEKQQEYCIDRTNLEETYTRNKIRHRIISAATELQPKAVEHVAEAADYLGQVEKLLQRLTKELFRRAVTENGDGSFYVEIATLEASEEVLAERVIYEALCRAYGKKKDITSGFVTDCMALMKKQTGRYLTLPSGLLVKKQFDRLVIGKDLDVAGQHYEEITVFPFRTALPEGGILTLTLQDFAETEKNFSEKMGIIPKSTYTKWFDYDKISNIISLKTPEAKDVIALYSDGRGKRVLDVLADAKVPKEKRQSVWLLAAGDQVLWIPGIRGSEKYHITTETKRVLIATIDGGEKNGRQD